MKSFAIMSVVGVLACASWSSAVLAGERIDEVRSVSASGHVTIENMRGEVKIYGWDKNEMTVKGELDEKATGYTFTSDNDYTQFIVKMPKRMGKRGWKNSEGSDLTIYLPTGSDVKFETVNGNVLIHKVAGGARVHSVNGNVEAADLKKWAKLETVNGNIEATNLEGKMKLATVNGRVKDKDSKGKVSYSTVNGTIEAVSKATEVYVENVNGEIDLSLGITEELEISTVNGNVVAELDLTDDTSVNVTTVSGRAKLKLGGDVGGDFRLSSHAGGKIVNDLTSDPVKKQKYGPGQSLKFNKSGGNARVEMTSVSGRLTIEER